MSRATGKDRATRQSRVGLAAYFRQRFPMAVLADMFTVVLTRKMPLVRKIADGEPCDHPPVSGEDCTCGLEVVEDPDTYDKPTLDQMLLVLSRIMERSFGQPAQHVHVEQEIRAEIQAVAAGVDLKYLANLPREALDSIRSAIKGVGAGGPPRLELAAPVPRRQEPTGLPGDLIEEAQFRMSQSGEDEDE